MSSSVLITGANGQLGRELRRAAWPAGTTVSAWSSADLDISDAAAVQSVVERVSPTVIVNAAAYTAVDTAEDEEERATLVNGAAVAHLAAAANAVSAALIHVSTDYVFDGSKADWYVEDDDLAPIGAYGRSKAVGEAAALSAERSVVLRTAWVYGALGSNFVTTMLRLAGERDVLGVVDDQYGCPTATADIAAAILRFVEAFADGSAPPERTYHVCSPDDATWHQFAMAVFAHSTAGFSGVCNKLTTAEYPTKAIRPPNSRLDSSRLERDLGLVLPSWRTSLPLVVAELEQQEQAR